MTFQDFQLRHTWRALVDDEQIGFFSNPEAALSTARHQADEKRREFGIRKATIRYGFLDVKTGLKFDERGQLIGGHNAVS